MRTISEKSRKVLRKIYLFFGAAVISMLFAACYGMPMDCWEDCKDPCCKPPNKEIPNGNPENSENTDTE